MKIEVDRTAQNSLVEYMFAPTEKALIIDFPEQEDLDKIIFDKKHIAEFVKLAYPISSDRTLTKIVDIAKVVKYVWNLDEEESLCKTAQLMFPSIEAELTGKIFTPEKVDFKNELNKLKALKSVSDIVNSLAKLDNLQYKLSSGNDAKLEELKERVKDVVINSNNDVLKDKYFQLNSVADVNILDLIG